MVIMWVIHDFDVPSSMVFIHKAIQHLNLRELHRRGVGKIVGARDSRHLLWQSVFKIG